MKRIAIVLSIILAVGLSTAKAQFQVPRPGGGSGSGAPTDGTYVTQTPNSTLTAEQALSLLGSGVVLNTTGTGVLTIYTGTSCTNQVIRALSAAGVATCETITSSFVDGSIVTLSGALTSGRVPYATGANALADEDGHRWNATNNTLELSGSGQTLLAPETAAQLHVGGALGVGTGSVLIDGYGNLPVFTMRRTNGTAGSPTALAANDIVFNFRGVGHDGTDSALGGLARMVANGAWSGTNHGMDFLVGLTANGSTSAPTETFRLTTEGLRVGQNLGTVATTGVIRIPNDQYLYARGGTAINVKLLGVTPSNAVAIGDDLRVNQIGEVWETEPNNGDFRPVTTNARDLGGSSRVVRSAYINKLVSPFQTVTTTGTENALAVTSSLIRLNNTTDLTINGIAAGVDGQRVTFVSVNTGNVFFTHNSGSAAAGDKLTNLVTTAVTPLAAARGRATYVYSAAAAGWLLVDHNQGAFITETFAAGDFTANGSMTWTVASGDVGVASYFITGRVMIYNFRYSTTTVGGTLNTTLIKSAPLGATVAVAFDGIFYSEDNGTKTTGWLFNNSNTGIGFAKLGGGNWATSTDNTRISGSVTFGIL